MAVRVKYPRRQMPGVSLVSLANLAFLIVIFMIFILKFERTTKVKEISPPISNSAFELIGQKYTSTIVILNESEIYAEGTKINSLSDLKTIYLPKAQRDLTVFIKADKNVNVRTIMDIMDNLKNLGISKIALITGG